MPSLEIRSRPGVRWYWAPDGQQEARRFSGYRGGSPRAHVLASDPGADVPGEKTRKQDAAHAEESADLKTGTFLSVSDSLPAAFAARSISARNCNTATCDIVSARREERGSARFVLTGELSFFFFFSSLFTAFGEVLFWWLARALRGGRRPIGFGGARSAGHGSFALKRCTAGPLAFSR